MSHLDFSGEMDCMKNCQRCQSARILAEEFNVSKKRSENDSHEKKQANKKVQNFGAVKT